MSRREKKNKTNIVGKKKVPYDEIILKDGIEYKYCRVCTKLLLLTDFHKHKQVKILGKVVINLNVRNVKIRK